MVVLMDEETVERLDGKLAFYLVARWEFEWEH